jgi:hypothetical protein
MRFPVKEGVIGETLGWLALNGATNGGNSYTTTTRPFGATGIGSQTLVLVADTRWMIVGANVFVGIGSTLSGGTATGATTSAGGVWQVASIAGPTACFLQNVSGFTAGTIGPSAGVGPAGP